MNDKLNIQNLIDFLAEKHGIDKNVADGFVKGFFALIEEGLEKDKYVKIKGLGTFKLIDVESRESINVNTGERIEIQGHTKISFTPDLALKEIINRPFSHFETVPLNENTVFDDMLQATNEDIEEESLGQPEAVNEGKSEQPDGADTNNETQEFVKEIELKVESGGVSESAMEFAEPIAEETDESAAERRTPEPVAESDDFDESLDKSKIVPESVMDSNEGEAGQLKMEKEKMEDGIEKVHPFEETPKSNPISFQRETSEQQETFQSSTSMKHLVYVLLLVMLLCGGIVLYMYFPDLLANKDYRENDSFEMLNDTLSMDKKGIEKNTIRGDSIAVSDRTPVVLPDTLYPVPQKTETNPKTAVKSEKESSSRVKEKKTNVPFVTDSVSYVIAGTKASYTIKEGETLTKVALRFYGTKSLWPYLVKHNPDIIKNPNNVPSGTTIKIPKLVQKK